LLPGFAACIHWFAGLICCPDLLACIHSRGAAHVAQSNTDGKKESERIERLARVIHFAPGMKTMCCTAKIRIMPCTGILVCF
jgi:hypothetical protein